MLLCVATVVAAAAPTTVPPSPVPNTARPARAALEPDSAGRIVAPRPGAWYSLKVSAPTVIRFGPRDWRMWAYGREANFSDEYPTWSFGRSGYFVSADGVHWQPVAGPGVLGSVVDPRRGTDRFDGGASGLTDVIYVGGVFFGYITGVRDVARVGADRTRPAAGPFGARGFQRVRIGAALSRDGIHWAPCDAPAPAGAFGAVVDGGEQDLTPLLGHVYAEGYDPASDPVRPPPPRGAAGGGAAAAALLRQSEADCAALAAAAAAGRQFGSGAPRRPGGGAGGGAAPLTFSMNYNSLSIGPGGLPVIKMFYANAPGHQLLRFKKAGPFQAATLRPSGPNSTAFDSATVAGGRRIRVPGKNEWLLFYEGADKNVMSSIGIARSPDGVTFTKEDRCRGAGAAAPGGPVLSPRKHQPRAWDAWQTGTPFPLILPNGTLYLYYVGMNNFTRLAATPHAPEPGASGRNGSFKSKGDGGEVGEGVYGAELGLAMADPEPSGAYCRFRRVVL